MLFFCEIICMIEIKFIFYIEADKCNVQYVLNKDFEMSKLKFPYPPVQFRYDQCIICSPTWNPGVWLSAGMLQKSAVYVQQAVWLSVDVVHQRQVRLSRDQRRSGQLVPLAVGLLRPHLRQRSHGRPHRSPQQQVPR